MNTNTCENINQSNNEFKTTFKFNEHGLSFNEILEKNFKNFIEKKIKNK